jgi:hypothetical protein
MSKPRSRTRAGEPPQRAGARPVSKARDRHEREADSAADVVGRGGSVAGWSFTAVPASAPVQRQDDLTGKPLSDDERKKEAVKKAAEAFLDTKPGKEVKDKVLNDPVVKPIVDAATSPGGLALLIGGTVGGLAAAHEPLPFQLPSIPLDRITPGLEGSVDVEGPLDRPTSVGLSLTFHEQGPKKRKQRAGEGDVAERIRALRDRRRPAAEKLADKQLADEDVQAFIHSQKLTVPLTPGATQAPQEEPRKQEEQAPVQRAPASTDAAAPETAEVDGALAGPGRPLDPGTRRAMEARFGRDFSEVRIHDDARAAEAAAELDAAAFTVGEDVAFAAGRYAPAGEAGRRLLAHELAHTIQQRGAGPKTGAGRGARSERRAGRAAAVPRRDEESGSPPPRPEEAP